MAYTAQKVHEALCEIREAEDAFAVFTALRKLRDYLPVIDTLSELDKISVTYHRAIYGRKNRKCSESGCNEPHSAKGLCAKHYQQEYQRKRKIYKT